MCIARKFVYLFFWAVVPMSMVACMPPSVLYQPGGPPQVIPKFRQTTVVGVQNNCATTLKIFSPLKVYAEAVRNGEPFTVVLVREPLSSDRIPLTVTGKGEKGENMGSQTRDFFFYLDGTHQDSWEINYLSKGPCIK
jgi:hypothetical protein